jgi:hypothetical protein
MPAACGRNAHARAVLDVAVGSIIGSTMQLTRAREKISSKMPQMQGSMQLGCRVHTARDAGATGYIGGIKPRETALLRAA